MTKKIVTRGFSVASLAILIFFASVPTGFAQPRPNLYNAHGYDYRGLGRQHHRVFGYHAAGAVMGGAIAGVAIGAAVASRPPAVYVAPPPSVVYVRPAPPIVYAVPPPVTLYAR